MRLALRDRAVNLVGPGHPHPYYGDEPDPDRKWYTRPGFLLSAALLAAILLLGVRLIWFNDNPSTTPAPSATPQVQGPAEVSDSCPTTWPDQPPPPASRAEATWRFIGNIEAPAAHGLGPAANRPVTNPVTGQAGELPVCYAPGPGGALLAAANWLAAGNDPALMDAAIRQLTAPSAGRDAMIARLEAEPELLNAAGSTGFDYIGYRFQPGATDTQTTVALAIRNTSGATGTVTVTLVRDADDWHIVPPPSGDLQDITRQVTSLVGYTDWS